MIDFIPYTFNKSDVIKYFNNDIQYNNWLANMLKAKKAVKIRNNLYTIIDINGFSSTTKYEIATKISDDSFISHHSALEYYGLANQVFNIVTVGSKKRFNTFDFDGIEYIRQPNKHDTQINYINAEGVRVTSLERTIIDCIDKIDISGGIEEILYALEQVHIIDENKLIEVLITYDSIYLYQKVGYILEYFKEQLALSDEFFLFCQNHLTNQVKYFLQKEYGNIKYNSKWKLMAPVDLKSYNIGG